MKEQELIKGGHAFVLLAVFEDVNDYEHAIRFNLFFAHRQKDDNSESFIVLYFTSKEALLSLLDKFKPSPDRKKKKLLTFANLFPPLQELKPVVE